MWKWRINQNLLQCHEMWSEIWCSHTSIQTTFGFAACRSHDSRLMILITKEEKNKTIFHYITIITINIASIRDFFLVSLQNLLRESKDVAKANAKVSSSDIENHSLHHRRFPAFKFKEICCEVKSSRAPKEWNEVSEAISSK